MTAIIYVRASATVDACYWFEAYQGKRMVAQTCKEHEKEGIAECKRRAQQANPQITRFMVKRPEDAEPIAH